MRMEPVDAQHPDRVAVVRGPVVFVLEGAYHDPNFSLPLKNEELATWLVAEPGAVPRGVWSTVRHRSNSRRTSASSRPITARSACVSVPSTSRRELSVIHVFRSAGFAVAVVVTNERVPTKQLRWGGLGAAKIATVKVIPAMQRSTVAEIAALASRDGARAADTARSLGIPRVYGSYDELLDDPDIDAIYNPLPNHLHVPWTITRGRARQARAVREADRADGGETPSCSRGARPHRHAHPGSVHGARASAMAARGSRSCAIGRIGDAPRDARRHSATSTTIPQRSQPCRSSAAADCSTSAAISSYVALHFRSRAATGGGDDRSRSEVRRRSAGVDHSGFRGRHVHRHVRDAVGVAPTRPDLRHPGRLEIAIPFNAPPDRSCRIVIDPDTDRLPGRAASASIRRSAISTRCRATRSRARSSTGDRSRTRSRSRSATCACSMPLRDPPPSAAGWTSRETHAHHHGRRDGVALRRGQTTRPCWAAGETLVEYALFDARRAGFSRAVLIGRPSSTRCSN